MKTGIIINTLVRRYSPLYQTSLVCNPLHSFHPSPAINMRSSYSIAAAAALLAAVTSTTAFNPQCNDNVVMYWGQDSYGIQNPSDTANWEHNLAYYCTDSTADVINISFLDVVSDSQGNENLNFANHCSDVFAGTQLLHCPTIGQDIKTCQAAGKKIILSVGGASGGYVLSSTADADALAAKLWNNYLGGSSSLRPFDTAVLDGVDFDIEAGSGTYYDEVTNKLRTYFATDSSKSYYISGAPECPQDNHMVDALKDGWFDWLNFYNNYCAVGNYPTNWDFSTWQTYATSQSKNPNVKILIGVPVNTADGGGAATLSGLETIISANINAYSSFGGVMVWETSDGFTYQDGGRTWAPALSQFIKSVGKCGSQPGTTTHTTTTTTTTTKTSTQTTTTSKATSTTTSKATTTTTKATSTTTKATSTPTPSGTPGACTAANNGAMVCVAPNSNAAYQECVNNAWLSLSCSPGTVCQQSGTSIYCGFPAAAVAKRQISNSTLNVIDFSNLAKPGNFEYLVKIATLLDPLPNKWSVSFDVPSGQKVKSVSRGTFRQKGNTVTIRSPRHGEPKTNMQILITVTGVSAKDTKNVSPAAALGTPLHKIKFTHGL